MVNIVNSILFLYPLVVALVTINCNGVGQRVSVFGASGGVGQQICRKLILSNFEVTAISRNVNQLADLELLRGCKFCKADARDRKSLDRAIAPADHIVISVGTTAFPTLKWSGGNDPKAACFDTVQNIMSTVSDSVKKPKKVVMLTSIGVERQEKMPFKVLNSYGILDQKRKAELLLIEYASKVGFQAVICRPGRLVGEPFTNFDLAKLLKLDQGSNKGVIIDRREVVVGDVERKDVAESIVRLLEKGSRSMGSSLVYSIVNAPGKPPTDDQWNKLLTFE